MLRRILTLGIVALALGLVAPAIGVQAGIGAAAALAQDPPPAPDPEDPPDAPDEPEAPDAPDEPEAPEVPDAPEAPDAPNAPEDDEGSGDADETDDDGDDEDVAPAPAAPAPAAPAPAAVPAPVETGPAPVQVSHGTDVEGKNESHKPSGSAKGDTRHLTTTPQRAVFRNTTNRTSGTDTGTFPQGGIQAGAGGMAEDRPASLLLLGLGALGLGLMAGGVALRRRSLGS
jgi:hypothetical protein